MKRNLTILLSLLLLVSLASCQAGGGTDKTTESKGASETAPGTAEPDTTEKAAETENETAPETEPETEAETDPPFLGFEVTSISFLGDSITYGTGVTPTKSRFSTVLAKRFGATEYNSGTPGSLLADAGSSANEHNAFVHRISKTDKGDVAVIFGGTNDYFWSDHPISGGDTDAYFDHAVKTLCQYVVEHRQGKPTLFVTPYPHNGIGNYFGGADSNDSSRHDTDSPNYFGHTLKDYADTIERICGEYGIPCLNLYRDFPFDWEQHTVDGCHPNEEGHRLIADAIEAELNAMLGRTAAEDR